MMRITGNSCSNAIGLSSSAGKETSEQANTQSTEAGEARKQTNKQTTQIHTQIENIGGLERAKRTYTRGRGKNGR